MAEGIIINTPPPGPDAPPVVAGERPAWLPENFENPEAFAQSYKELQAKLTEKGQEKPPEKTAEEIAAEAAAAAEQTPEQKAEAEARAKMEAGGVNYEALQTKFMENGKIEESDYETLGKLGFSRDVVDAHIESQTSKAETIRTETMALAGGEQAFNTAMAWARSGAYSTTQVKAYNDAVDSGDTGRMQQAVKALKADYDKVHGTRPSLLNPTNTPPAGGDVYQSFAQLTRDQGTDLYKSDPAERARVLAKLGRSKI